MFPNENLYYDHPNFSIRTPGGCNANCPFCFYKRGTEELSFENYLNYISHVVKNIPPECNAVSITGGEPTTSYNIGVIMAAIGSKRFERVVLTTNGLDFNKFNFKEYDNLTHVNVSYHHHMSAIRAKIYGRKTIPGGGHDWEPRNDMRPVDFNLTGLNTINHMKNSGKIFSLSCTLTDQFFSYEEFANYIEHIYVANINHGLIDRVMIRVDHAKGIAEDHPFEVLMNTSDVRFNYEGGMENDCVKHGVYKYKNSLKVDFKYAVLEPSDVMDKICKKTSIYEYICQPNGKVTLDWGGNKVIYDHLKDYQGDDVTEIKNMIGEIVKRISHLEEFIK